MLVYPWFGAERLPDGWRGFYYRAADAPLVRMLVVRSTRAEALAAARHGAAEEEAGR